MSIIKCRTEEGIRRVKNYLGSNYEKVPYLYTNLYKYGIGNANVEVWVDVIDEQIRKACGTRMLNLDAWKFCHAYHPH